MILKKIDNIDLFCIRISEELESLNSCYSILSLGEKKKADRFYFKKDSDSYIISHGFLRNILCDYIPFSAKEILFKTNPFGKPGIIDVQNINEVKFNISHSGDYCLIAITRYNEIGVDIEKIRDIKEYMKLAERFFSSYENSIIKDIEEAKKLHCFYTIWTQKEALIKASGEGLSFGLSHWSSQFRQSNYSISVNNISYDMIVFNIDSEYCSTLCIKHI